MQRSVDTLTTVSPTQVTKKFETLYTTWKKDNKKNLGVSGVAGDFEEKAKLMTGIQARRDDADNEAKHEKNEKESTAADTKAAKGLRQEILSEVSADADGPEQKRTPVSRKRSAIECNSTDSPIAQLVEARKQKDERMFELEDRKLKLEENKLAFEKQKWLFEHQLK